MNGLESKCLVEITRGELLAIKEYLDTSKQLMYALSKIDYEHDELTDLMWETMPEVYEIVDSLLYKDEYKKEDIK